MRTDNIITGSVHRQPRKQGSDVWTFRFRDADRKQRNALLGRVDKMTAEQAHRKAHRLRATLFHNRTRMTVRQVIQLYEQEGIPARESTAGPLRSQLKRIDQEFGSLMFDDFLLDIAGVERWLRDLQTTPGIRKDGVVFRAAEPMARKTKAHIKALLHRLGEFAMKHGVLDLQRNPMSLVEVRTGPRRKRTPTILTSEQFWQLLAESEKIDGAQHVVVMAQVAMFLGLRISEVLGLRWADVDLIGQAISISRSSVGQSIDETKTEGSATDLPLDPALVRVLAAWHGAKPVIGGWLFGSPYTNRPFRAYQVPEAGGAQGWTAPTGVARFPAHLPRYASGSEATARGPKQADASHQHHHDGALWGWTEPRGKQTVCYWTICIPAKTPRPSRANAQDRAMDVLSRCSLGVLSIS